MRVVHVQQSWTSFSARYGSTTLKKLIVNETILAAKMLAVLNSYVTTTRSDLGTNIKERI